MFKKGDLITCIDNEKSKDTDNYCLIRLTLGSVYKVKDIINNMIYVVDDSGSYFGYYQDRFELAKTKHNNWGEYSD